MCAPMLGGRAYGAGEVARKSRPLRGNASPDLCARGPLREMSRALLTQRRRVAYCGDSRVDERSTNSRSNIRNSRRSTVLSIAPLARSSTSSVCSASTISRCACRKIAVFRIPPAESAAKSAALASRPPQYASAALPSAISATSRGSVRSSSARPRAQHPRRQAQTNRGRPADL